MPAPASCPPGEWKFERRGDSTAALTTRSLEACSVCGGTGLIRSTLSENGRTYDAVVPCAFRKLQQRAERFNAAKVPAVHSASEFENYRPSCTEQDTAQKTLRAFCLTWPGQRGVVLSGPVGTGKTHLLSAVIKHLVLERGASAAYVEMSLLFSTIRRGFQEGKSGGEIIRPLCDMDLLVLDELGKGRGSAFEMETLDELVARRYNSGKATLFATNYSLKSPEGARKGGAYLSAEDLKDAGKDSRLLVDRVGDRIFSRLYEMCDFIEFPSGTDDGRRAKQAKAASRIKGP